MTAFAYRKGDQVVFLDTIEASRMHEDLIKHGYRHISTINSCNYLNIIGGIVRDEDISDRQKVIEIRKLLESE